MLYAGKVQTYLGVAINSQRPDMLQLLLEAGSNPDVVAKNLNPVLFQLSYLDSKPELNLNILKMLIAHGVSLFLPL